MAAFFLSYDGWIAWYLLLLTLCLPVLSLLLSLPRMLRLKIETAAPRKVIRGNPAAVQYTLSVGQTVGEVRLRIRMRDLYGGTVQRLRRTLSADAPLTVSFPTEHCGVYLCELRSAAVSDLLGLFSLPVRRQKSTALLVLPHAIGMGAPDFETFRARSFRPKPGGGFSELYELREYRPGDPIHAIHWKLSAKRDDLIVREAEEAVRRRTVVSFSLTPIRLEMDEILDELYWVTEKLLSFGEHPVLCYRASDFGRHHIESVESRYALEQYLGRLLRRPVKKATHPDHAQFRQAEWYYQIPREAKQEAAK